MRATSDWKPPRFVTRAEVPYSGAEKLRKNQSDVKGRLSWPKAAREKEGGKRVGVERTEHATLKAGEQTGLP